MEQSKLLELLKDMSLEEKIGQLFMVNLEQLDNSEGNYYEHTVVNKKMKKIIQKKKRKILCWKFQNFCVIHLHQNNTKN